MGQIFSQLMSFFKKFLRLRTAMDESMESGGLVKARPTQLNLEDHFQMVRDEGIIADAFDEMRRELFRQTNEPPNPDMVMAKPLFREYGSLGEGRRYFYLQRSGERGTLFEQTGTGWVISKAEKIASQDMFLRTETPIDIVHLYQKAKNRGRKLAPRVASPRLGQGYLPGQVYRQKLLKLLMLDGSSTPSGDSSSS